MTQARESLRNAGISNVEVRQGDGSKLTAADGSFDAIALSGSVAQVPANLLKLLKSGGRLVAIVGDEPVMRCTVVTKTGENTYHTQQSWDTVAPRLQNFPEPTRFTF